VAHAVGARCVNEGSLPDDQVGDVHEEEGYTITVTEEMVDAVWTYIEYVDKLLLESSGHTARYVEVDLTPALSKLHPKLGGTADCVVWNAATRVLHIADYKHGAGILVNVFENKQLTYYALGALLTFPDFRPKEVCITIVQPRCGSEEPVRSYTFATVDLLDFTADLLDAVAATEKPDAPLVPGEVQCQWCRAAQADKCPALKKQTSLVMADEFADLTVLPDESLERALAILPAVELRCKAIRELAYQKLMAGGSGFGYKLIPKKGRRKFTDLDAVASLLTLAADAATLAECYTKPGLKTPAKVEAALGKKRFAALVGALAPSVSSGYNMVPADHPTSAAPLAIATADEFDKL